MMGKIYIVNKDLTYVIQIDVIYQKPQIFPIAVESNNKTTVENAAVKCGFRSGKELGVILSWLLSKSSYG